MSCVEVFQPEAPKRSCVPSPQGSPWGMAFTGLLSASLSGMEREGLTADLPLANPLACCESPFTPYVMQS